MVAVMVAVSPVVPPVTENVGVVSLVMLSASEIPVSDEADKSGADGDAGGLVSTTRDDAALRGEEPPVSESVPVMFQVPSASAGSVQEVAVPMT